MKNVYIYLALLGVFAFSTNCENVPQSPMNIYQIVVFFLNYIGLMSRADSLRDYASFMDEALRAEIEYVFGRIAGFARDESQFRQWAESARQFVRVFVLRTIVEQGRAHLDAYFARFSRNSNEPHMLLEQCARQVAEQTAELLSQEFDFPLIDDEILFYELIHITRLRVTAISGDTPPYFQLRLENSVSYRPINEIQPSTSTPYAPLNNCIRDWEGLRSVYSRFYFNYEFKTHEEEESQYISADVFDFARAHLARFLAPYNFTTKIVRKIERPLIVHALFWFLFQFFSANYNWLTCHPAHERYAASDAHMRRLIDDVGRAHREQIRVFRNREVLPILIEINYPKLVENFRESLARRGVVVRYTSRAPFATIQFLASSNATTCE